MNLTSPAWLGHMKIFHLNYKKTALR